MDPKVTITETSPPSTGYRVRGFLAEDVWLNCYVENLPTDLTVRWQRTMFDKLGRETVIGISVDMDLQDNMKWSIEKPTPYSWRLRIRGLEVADEGNYTCFVVLTSNNNRVMSNRTVIVTDKPIILEEFSTSDMTVKEGDFVPLRCNASGRPYPTIMWRREGNAIVPGGGVIVMGSVLDISNIQYDARGRYFCEAMNEVGEDRREVKLTVLHSPKILPELAKVGQMVGYQRTLVCLIDANPAPSVEPSDNQLYWTFASQRISQDDRLSIRVLEGAYGRLTFELTLGRVQATDFGVYSCYARNSIATTSAAIELYEASTPQPDRDGQISRAAPVVLPPPSLWLALIAIVYYGLHWNI